MAIDLRGMAPLLQVRETTTSLRFYRDVMKQLYVTHPDGYGLCLQWPASESAQQQREIFRPRSVTPA